MQPRKNKKGRAARTELATNLEKQDDKGGIGNAERDLVALCIATAAIILFVATGSSVLPGAIKAILGDGRPPDPLLVNALLLNIALIVFGWRRYRELRSEIPERRRAEERARALAETDPLTGCLNRRSMADRRLRMAAVLILGKPRFQGFRAQPRTAS